MNRLSILLVFLIIIPLKSQDYADKPWDSRITYGLFINSGINLHLADFRALDTVPSCCPGYRNGSGLNLAFGLAPTFPLSEKIELSTRLGFHLLNGTLSRIEEIRVAGQQGEGVDGEFKHSIRSDFGLIALEPLLAYRLTDQFRILAGLRFGFLLDKRYEQKEEIISPSFGTFENGQRTRNEHHGNIPNASSIEAALSAGVSYDIPLNTAHTFFLSPEFFTNIGLTSLSKKQSWYNTTLRGGLSLKYAPRKIIPPPPPIIPPPPPPLPPPPPPPAVPILDAHVIALGVDENGNETDVPILKVEEFLSNRMHPLLNYIFFDENSSDIPARYYKLTESERNRFSVKELYNLKTLDVYYHILNIVGKRMETYPQARITLIGCNSNEGKEANNLELSRRRAEAVKNFLVNIWEIQPDRIEIKTRNLPEVPSNPNIKDGIEENRRVEIIANIPQVFEPIVISDTIRESNPPNIRFKIRINTDIGIATWDLLTFQSNRELRRFTGSGMPPVKIDWDVKLEEEQKYIPRFTEPLNYKLQIVDKDNKIWQSPVKELPVEQLTIEKKMMELIEDKEIDKFSLILFGFGQHELSPDNLLIAQFAKNRITRYSTVKIRGYTDRVGDEDYNLRLSQRRAEATAKALGVDVKYAKGLGESVLLYDNDLPEGRFYCRTVQIDIITPIQ